MKTETKRTKLLALINDMPQYIVADVSKICEEYEERYGETIAKSYVIRLCGTTSERVRDNTVPKHVLNKIKDLIFTLGSKKQLKRLINQVMV